MSEFCIICVYIGKLPNYYNIWLNSIKYNSRIDFLFFTDQNISENLNNLKIINIDLNKFNELLSNKLNYKIEITRPYKICDYKPMFGTIFSEYLIGYDYWGHCDMDMVFGDLYKFFIENDIFSYNKFLPNGHLSMYKNDNFTNNIYKMKGGKVNYIDVFKSNESKWFDEFDGIYSIFKKNRIPFMDKRLFVDVSQNHKRFKMSKFNKYDKNYRNQVFYYDNGKTFWAYEHKKEIVVKEVIYIHYQKRKFQNELKKFDNFYIINGFFLEKKEDGKPSIDIIKKINPYPGFFYEFFELLVSYWKRFKKKFFKK